MTSTNDGKDVKSYQTSGPKGKTYYIELYKSLEARLSEGGDASKRTQYLCEAWQKVHSLCQHSAPSTHTHLLSWLQRHTARAVLQTEWQTPARKDDRKNLEEAIDVFIAEAEANKDSRNGESTPWEEQLVERGVWFKRVLEHPWDHPVLTLLLNPNGTPPTDDEVLKWLKEERGVTFVMRLHTLVGEKCDDIAMSLATAVMERVRAGLPPVIDSEEPKDVPPPENALRTFGDKLKEEAGFTPDVWEMLTDIEFVLLHKRDSKRCIALAKQTPLLSAYPLIERLQKRLEIAPREKRLWKNAKEVAILIAQVVIARCMMERACAGAGRTALYCCARLLARMLAARLPAAADALANQAPTARHLHTLAHAVDRQLAPTNESMKPYICELYVRAITAGMNELERLKLKTEKEAEARSMEKMLASWFVQLGEVLSRSDRIRCECTLTAFSLHPSQNMYERLHKAPQPTPVAKDSDESKEETVKTEFGSWASDSRSQTNFVKTSETLKMKHTQNQANVMSTAIFNEGEALGLSPELCQDLAVLLSGPRVKTLSWDMDRTLLLENCRAYSEQTHGGTRVLTRELKYLNIDPNQYQHLPEDRDDDENDPYYGIERGYEHLAVPEDPEEIWEDANDLDRTDTASSSVEDDYIAPQQKKKNKRIPLTSDEDSDPLSFMAEAKRVQKKKERPHSKERSKERAKKKHELRELVDPLLIDGPSTQDQNQNINKPKEKKERKKKEKIPKVKVEKRSSLLASLVGVKVVKNKRKFAKNTTLVKTPVTDSDYDSQGKCSWASMNSEGNEHDEGTFSIDEIKSFEHKNQICSLKLMKSNESLVTSSKVNAKISPSLHLQRPPNNQSRLQYRPPIPNAIRGQSPSHLSRKVSPNLTNYPDDIRASITKLLEFRRQRNAKEQNLKLQNTPHIPPRKPAIIRQDVSIQSNISPKAVAIPEIPKSYIQKQHAEKLAELKREVDNILSQRREKKANSSDSVIQYANKSDKALTPENAYQSRRVQQSNTNSLKMTDFVNIPYDRLMAEIAERGRSNNNEVMKSPQIQHQPGQYGLQRSSCVVSAGQRDYQKFLKEYDQSKYSTSSDALDMSAKRLTKDVKRNIKPISRVVPFAPNFTKPESKSPQCAKQSTQVKKPDNFLNTFSRLSYMHKNKQTELKNKNSTEKPAFTTSTYQEVSSELDQIIKDHQQAQMRVIQTKHEKFDRLLEQTSNSNTNTKEFDKKSETSGTKHPLLSNLLQNSLRPNSITSMCRNESQLKNYQTQKPVSIPKTSMSDKDQNDLLNLLRQRDKLNVSLHRSTSMISKPSTSKLNNAITKNFTSMTDYNSISPASKSNNAITNNFLSLNDDNSTPGQKQHVQKPTFHANSSPSLLETKIINIISNSLVKQQTNVNADNCDSVKSTSIMYPTMKSVRATDSHEKDKKSTANKGHAKQNPVNYVPEEKPEWQSVMSDLLKHKTPVRGPNALDVALNKSSFELAFEKSLQTPSIFASKQPTIENNFESKQKGKSNAPKSVTTSAHNVNITNKEFKIKAGLPNQQKCNAKKSSNLKNLAIAMNDKMNKQNIHEVAKKLPQEVQKKQFTYAVPKNDDPFISGIPNSDYDLLEELMDDDLRKEIGELSSDDESYNVAAQSFLKPNKGNEKRVSVEFNKSLNDSPTKKSATDMRCLNACQSSCETMQSATQKPVIRCANKMPQIAPGSNKIKESQNIANVKIQDNIGSITSISQSSTHLLTTPNTQTQAYDNAQTLCKNQEATNSKMYISAVTQQAQLQNVVLIGSELVYERYTPVHTPLHCVSNTPPSAYVAVNNIPSVTFYQTTPFASPVVTPLIIGSSITVPIVNNVTCAAIPVQPSVISNLAQPIYPNITVETKTPVSFSCIDMETCHIKDEVRNSVPETDYLLQNNKLLDGNKASERKVLSEVQELAVNEKIDKTRSQKIEYDLNIKKDTSTNEERLKKKRLAIINREINHRCGDKPIPLAYSPLPVITRLVSKHHNFLEAVPLNFAPLSPNEDKHNSSDCEEEKLLTQIKNDLQDLSDSINEVQSPATPDSNDSKENKSKETIPYRKILLRSSNKIQTKSNTDSIVSDSSTNKKSKVKLKSEIPEVTPKASDKSCKSDANDKEAITPKRASKRLRNKNLSIAKDDKIQLKNRRRKQSPGSKFVSKSKVQNKLEDKTEKPSFSSINHEMVIFDVEAELLGSKIHKPVPEKRVENDSIKSKDYETCKTIATVKEGNDITSEIPIRQERECVSIYTTKETTDGVAANVIVNSILDKFNYKPINKTNEPAGDVSNDKTDKNTIVENVSNMPTCHDFDAEQENSDAKVKDMSLEISVTQKNVCAQERTTDVDTDNIAVKMNRNTNDMHQKVSDKLAVCDDFNKILTTDKDLKVSSDAQDLNCIKSVSVTDSEVLVMHEITEPTVTYDNVQISGNITSVDEQNTSLLTEKENIDLDMTVTCEEVNISKVSPIMTKIKTARNISINAKSINGVTISDEIKQNNTLVPTSSHTYKKTEFYNKNVDVAPVPANGSEVSKTKSTGTHSDVATISNTTVNTDDGILILDSDSQIKRSNKTLSDVPAVTNIMANTDDCIVIQDENSRLEVLRGTLSESRATRNTTTNANGETAILNDDTQTNVSSGKKSEITINGNSPTNTNNDIIVLDDDSKTTSEALLIEHNSKAAQKNVDVQATSSHTVANDASEIPQNFKDSIHIEHLPCDDPLKKSVRVSLPNGRKFKATVYGAVHVTFDTLFTYPSIKSTLLNGMNYRKLYTMNLKQITTVAKSDPTKIISAQILDVKTKPTVEIGETIDLLSDEEDECPARATRTNTQAFETEYGKYNISAIDQDIFAKHQNKFSQKLTISLKKIDAMPYSKDFKIDEMQNTTQLYQNKTLLSSIPDQYVKGVIKDIEDKLSPESNRTSADEIVEIDDSSSESHHDKSVENTQPDKTIYELKNVLLKELGVKQAKIPKNIIQRNKKENKKSNVKKINSKNKRCRSNSKLQLSAIPSGESFPFDDLGEEEQLKIINQKCFIQLIRCDDLVEMFKTNNRDTMELLSTNILDNELLAPKVPDHDEIIITENFSILNNLDENIVESEARSNSPVIELSEALVSLNNKSMVSSESADHQVTPFSCEAYWLTTKPKLHSMSRNTLNQPNIYPQNIKDVYYKSATSYVVNEISSKRAPTQNNCAPSLMSMVLKCFENTYVVHQYMLLHKAIIRSPANSLKRKSSLLRKRKDTKVPKLNDEIIVEKLTDCVHSSNATLDLSGSDMENMPTSIPDDININSEIKINFDQSIVCTKSLCETDNGEIGQISSSVCTTKCGDNHYIDEHNDVEKQAFDDNCCGSHNDTKANDNDTSYDTHDHGMEIVNLMSENNINDLKDIYKDHIVSPETMNILADNKTDIDSASEGRSSSPIIEIAHLLTDYDVNDDLCFIRNSVSEIEETPLQRNIENNPNYLASASEVDIEVKTILNEQVAVIRFDNTNENDPTPQSKKTINTISDRQNSNYINAPSLELETKQDEQKNMQIGSPNEVSSILKVNKEADLLLESEVTNVCSTHDILHCQVKDSNNCDTNYDFDDIEMKSAEKVGDTVKDVASKTQIQTNCNTVETSNKINENYDIDIKLTELVNESVKYISNETKNQQNYNLVKASNEINENYDIEIKLAKLDGVSVKDTASEIQIQENYNFVNASNVLNENESHENSNKEAAVDTKIIVNNKSLYESNLETIEFRVNHEDQSMHSQQISDTDKQLVEDSSRQQSTITDHKYVSSFIAKSLSSQVRSEDPEYNHETTFASEHEMVLLGDEETKELEEEITEMYSYEIIDSSLFENITTKIEKDKTDVTSHENLSTTVDDDCFNQVEEQNKKTVNVNIKSDIFDLATHDRNVSLTFHDDCSIQVEEKHQETEHVEGNILNEKLTFDLKTHDENIPKITECPATTQKMEIEILAHTLNPKVTCDSLTPDKNVPGEIGVNNSSLTETQEMITDILEDALNANETCECHDENVLGDNSSSRSEERQKKSEILEDKLNKKETCDAPTRDENVPEILKAVISEKEACNSPTHYENFLKINEDHCSNPFDDNCSSPAEVEGIKTKILEKALNAEEAFDLPAHELCSSVDEDCSGQVEFQDTITENLKDTLLQEEKRNEGYTKDSDEKCDFPIEEGIDDNTEKIMFTSTEVSAETILSKYLKLIGNDSEVVEGIVEYEDPEAGTCYVIPVIDKSSEIDIDSNENTEVITAVIQSLGVNKVETVNDEIINIDSTHEITQSAPSIEVNNHHFDDIEAKLAKIFGEPEDVDIEERKAQSSHKTLKIPNVEKIAAKVSLDEKYKTSLSVEVEVVSGYDAESEKKVSQLMGTNDSSKISHDTHFECSKENNKECITRASQKRQSKDYEHILVPENENLKVTVPKHTYLKGIEHIRKHRKSLKRKMDMSDTKTNEKKYRKGKNIDYPKITAAAISESAYAKEYKRLIDYCSSIKFSYVIPFHKIYVDVHNTLKSWPIKSSNVAMADVTTEANGTLFTDTEKSEALLNPMEQTLSDEIMSEYDENSYTCSNINETNFNMGFGERSDRVIQELKDGEYTTFSAATLSDVKQLQPCLPSDKQEALIKPDIINNEYQDQMLKTIRFVDRLNLKEKVRSFFKKTKAELTLDWVLHNKKDDFENINADSDWPFNDLASPRFILPSLHEVTVNVVQVGQLPVSAAAQNPVPCDPRVTHVSNVSPQHSPENSSGDELQTSIKTEYTELTTANITLPLMPGYAQHHHSTPTESQESTNGYGANNTISMATELKSVVKIELMEETSQENLDENLDYEYDNIQQLSNGNMNNGEQYHFHANNIATEPDSLKKPKAASSVSENNKQNDTSDRPKQVADALNAADISAIQGMAKLNGASSISKLTQNAQSDVVVSQANTGNYSKSSPISAIALQQALAQILPPPLNQTSTSDTSQQTSANSQVLHFVQGGNNAQSVINKPNGTQLLHIVQNKSAATTNATPTTQQNSFSGLSLVDGGIQQNGNQLLHIVNTGNQKNSNAGQLLQRVNLLTNLANVQGSNDQKMVQFVCKSADGKSIQLPHQRSMVLRLQTLDPSNSPATPKQNEAQDLTLSSSTTQSTNDKDPNSQEMKSRSLYEENYARFVQNGDTNPNQEKSTSLPKFNQVFGKQVYQEKQNEMDAENLPENSECTPEDSNVQLEQINDIGSPPMLIRKPQSLPSQTQPNLVQQIKQTIGSSNIQTMHGGVIYTRQIPVNLGNGQTINLITVPSTEMVDDSAKNQKNDAKYGNQKGDHPVIKIVPTSQPATTPNGTTEDNNAKIRSTNEATPQQTPQPQPVLTQMRIKLPMLSKVPQMVEGTRVVRPAFFQIQRNVIGGANQQVYQQLVLTAAPPLGQSIRLPAQAQKPKNPSETQSSPESQMSSSTLEQLREFDMVLEQVKERSTVQPGSSTSSTNIFTKLNTSPDTTDAPTPSTSTQDSSTPVLYSVGNTQPLNMVNYVNRKSTITSTTASSYVRSPDSTGVIESPTSSTHAHLQHTATSATSDSCASSSCASEAAASTSVTPKPKKKKSKPSTSNSNPFNIKNTPKPSSTQKPLEDEQTTQRILYILAEYKEQVENSPDKDKPAPRRRNNPAAPSAGSSKRKKSSSGSRRRDMSPVVGEDSCRTMGSEDSSCGTSLGECNECLDTHSPDESPRKVVRRLTFEQETHITQTRTIPQRNVIVTDGQAFAVRGATGKPATTVLMPANYLLPVSMVKGGQQIAIMTNRGPKLLVGAGDGGTGGTLLFQRLIGPGGLKPVLARPGVRHIRLPTTALHNLQAFNIATPATTVQPPDSTASPAPASTPPDLVDTRAMSSPWPDRDAGEVKPERGNSSPESSEPWNLPSSSIADDYGYEEIVRTDNMDRTVLDAIPDRYSPDMEAQRIFDKMFDSDSKKSMYDSRCGYDIDASDDDKAYHQVVQRKDGRHTTRLTHVSAAALRHKYAILEHELRLQKSLSEECEDLGVDSPSASELFPEAELFFAPSPAHEQTIEHCQTPPLTVLAQGIPQPDLDDQIATDHLTHSDHRRDELDLNLDDVGEIVTVGEDGMTTIPLDHEEFARAHEEFARSHPNTTFHSEPEDGEIPPFTIAHGIKGRQVTFHSRGVPGTVVVAPQTTVISQATVEASGTQNTVKFTDIDNMINAMPSPQHPQIVNMPSVVVKDGNDGLTKFDRLLNESRELHLSNTASAIVHSTGNGTQVIRRVHYETRRDARFLNEERDTFVAGEGKMAADDRRDMQSMGEHDTSSSERNSEMFWESHTPVRHERRRFEFSSDSDKCCRSPYDEVNSDSSGIGAHTRLDSVIKAARTERRRSDGSSTDDGHPPLRTYPPKRPHSHIHQHHSELERSVTGKTRANDRCHDIKDESRRRASNRGVVKRGCHCCNGSTAPPKTKKSRPKKSDFHSHN